ncbi:hypothetical protein DFJ77DRAFT_187682 [Powellomyces hirtus]|nr:hypothetical protein DFJ77DRAFT_187682 [Powellomyces hirtus]
MAILPGTTLGQPAQHSEAAQSHALAASTALALHLEDHLINSDPALATPAPFGASAAGAMSVLVSQRGAPANPKKLASWYTPRDSLVNRERAGKVGSRRRRRYDNDNFTEHPIVMKHGSDPEFYNRNDRFPGLAVPRPASPFTQLPHSLVNSLPTTTNPATAASAAEADRPIVPGESNLTRQDRKLLTQIRRTGLGMDVVKRFEGEIINRVLCVESGLPMDRDATVRERTAEEEAWVLLHDPDSPVLVPAPPLVLEITNKFLRLIVHAMCRYYRLVSHSTVSRCLSLTIFTAPTCLLILPFVCPLNQGMDERNGKRLTYIHPSADIFSTGDTDKHSSFPAVASPCTSFFDYLFA